MREQEQKGAWRLLHANLGEEHGRISGEWFAVVAGGALVQDSHPNSRVIEVCKATRLRGGCVGRRAAKRLLRWLLPAKRILEGISIRDLGGMDLPALGQSQLLCRGGLRCRSPGG